MMVRKSENYHYIDSDALAKAIVQGLNMTKELGFDSRETQAFFDQLEHYMAVGGYNWNDVMSWLRSCSSRESGSTKNDQQSTVWHKIRVVYENRSVLSNWRRGFIDSLYSDWGPDGQYTFNQIGLVNELYDYVITSKPWLYKGHH